MKHEILIIDDFRVIITLHDSESSLLKEAKHVGIPLVGTYSVIKHPPHTQPGEYHLHVYDDSEQIFAINKGGTAHDGFHGVRIPNKVYNALTAKYKGWLFPPDQIIESIYYTYILSPIADLSYRELLKECDIIQGELNLCDRIVMAQLNESINDNKIKHLMNQLQNRFKKLMVESINRI